MTDIEKKAYMLALAAIIDDSNAFQLSEKSLDFLVEISKLDSIKVKNDYIDYDEVIAFIHSKFAGE